jgi:hypothetical protein
MPSRRRFGCCNSEPFHPEQEVVIRILSVSLLAVAAVAASLVFSRAQSTSSLGIPAGESAPSEPSLDKIREAGL